MFVNIGYLDKVFEKLMFEQFQICILSKKEKKEMKILYSSVSICVS